MNNRFRLAFSVLVASALTATAQNEVDITLFPAELGAFKPAAGCCGYQYEVVVPSTTDPACSDRTTSGQTECHGTIAVDLSSATVLNMALKAPEGMEIELRTTGGSSQDGDKRGNPIQFQGIFENLQGGAGVPECGQTQAFGVQNMTSNITGTLVDGMELIESGLPTSWWRTDVSINSCRFTTKAIFGSDNFTTYRFKELKWSIAYDPSQLLVSGPQTYRYDTSFTYSFVYSFEGSAKVVKEGGDPPTSRATAREIMAGASILPTVAFAFALMIVG